MKQHISILMLLSKSTLYKLLILFALMISLESFLFWQTLNRRLIDFLHQDAVALYSLEGIFAESYIPWVFGICFLIQTALLIFVGCDFGSKQGYTLRRLNISERSVFLWQALYNAGCYLLLWMVQTIVALFLCQLYLNHNFLSENAETAESLLNSSNIIHPRITHQTIFLAFYRSNFLHSLLPLDDMIRFSRNILFILGLATPAAAFPYYQRRGKTSFSIHFLAVMCFFTFTDELGFYSLDGLSLLATIYAVSILYRIFIKERKEEAYEK